MGGLEAVNWAVELAIALLGAAGLVLNTHMFTPHFRRDMLAYYTNLSNLLVTLFYLARCLSRALGGRLGTVLGSAFLQFAAAVMIALTFVIYNFVLLPAIRKAPGEFGQFGNYRRFSNLCVHYIVPLSTVLNWLVFGPNGGLRWFWPLAWLALPLAYQACVLLRGRTGKNLTGTSSPYPYEFLNPQAVGWKRFGINTVFMLLIMLGLSYGLFGLGLLLG